jgi:hypothetical protein
MELRKIEITVAPETHDVGLALAKMVKEAKKAAADGFQPADIATVATGCFAELMTAVQGVTEIPAEGKAHLGATVRGALVPVTDALEDLVKPA